MTEQKMLTEPLMNMDKAQTEPTVKTEEKTEVDTPSTRIEQKLTHVGDIGVEIHQMRNDRNRYD